MSDVEAVLASIPMFEHLGDRQRARLGQHICRRAYPAGAVIVRQGDTSMSFYVVLSGRVRVVRHSAGHDGAGGDGVDILDEGPGSFFGEMGVIDDLPRAATVMALEPTECGLLAKWDFQRELSADPGIALSLISVLNARIRTLEDRLTATGGS
ncbi:MAG TPA: cyclic nucleotide-binding domain-containing protein [Acidimicrobiia bacterium]|nr:cyclic nucleotide-binding domain-containing protein [Acidimicrobiia bacterium]